MKKEKLDPTVWQNVKLLFKNKEHHYGRVLVAAQGGPAITLEIKDLVTDSVQILPDHNTLKLSPVFYKHDGKWHLLAGKGALADAVAKNETVLDGRLISTPALKSCRVIVAQPEEPVAVASAPSYPSRSYNNNGPRPYQSRGSSNPVRTHPGPNQRRDRP